MLTFSTNEQPAAPVGGKESEAAALEGDEVGTILSFAAKAVVAGAASPVEEAPIVTEDVSPGVTPASDGRASPSFSRPSSEPPTLQRTALEIESMESLLGMPHATPPTVPPLQPALKRTASEMDGIQSLMGLATSSAKRSLACDAPTAKRQCSDVTIHQLKLTAAAFRLCPEPTADQVGAIARRVALPAERVATWFEARRALQSWVHGLRAQVGVAASADLVASAWARCATVR